MRLHELASSAVFTVEADDPIDVAIDVMEEHQIRHLPVLLDRVAVGMVSERDLLFHVGWQRMAERKSTRDATVPVAGPTRIEEIMTRPLVALAPDELAEKAARLMLNKSLHAIALVGSGRVVGIVTETDFLKCYSEHRSIASQPDWWQQTVSDRMTCDLVSVEPREKALAALRLMRQWQIRHLPVVDEGKLVGIVSDRDICRGMARDTIEKVQDPQPHITLMDHHSVRNLMNRDVESTTRSATLAQAADHMVRRRIGSLPVTDQDRLVGIITETDLLRALLAACENK